MTCLVCKTQPLEIPVILISLFVRRVVAESSVIPWGKNGMLVCVCVVVLHSLDVPVPSASAVR